MKSHKVWLTVILLALSMLLLTGCSAWEKDARQELIDQGLVPHKVEAGESWMKFVEDFDGSFDTDYYRDRLQEINEQQAKKGFVSNQILYPGDLVLVPISYKGLDVP